MGLVSQAPFATSHNVFESALADSICKAIHLQVGCVCKGQALETAICATEELVGIQWVAQCRFWNTHWIVGLDWKVSRLLEYGAVISFQTAEGATPLVA